MQLKIKLAFGVIICASIMLCAKTYIQNGKDRCSIYSRAINTNLVTPNSTIEVQKLYQFLCLIYGKKILSSVMTLSSFDEINWLKKHTAKEPAMIGLDFMHCNRGYKWYDNTQPVKDAGSYWNRNGIPVFCWHWRDPSRITEAFYTKETSFDVTNIFKAGSAEYAAMIRDIDSIAGYFKILQAERIPAIWRPLHEAAGGWFWWGAKGPAACKKLYHVMYDRMVNYHGLRNLIWVWTVEPDDEAWYPGDEYVDIIGRDLYIKGNHNSQINEFKRINKLYQGKKMITLSECGSLPDPGNLVKDHSPWLWFMPWYGYFVKDTSYNSLELWKRTLEHEYVISLDEMPSFKTSERITIK